MPTALIVENDDIREILTWLIRLHGLDAEAAVTGVEALAKVGRDLDLVTLNPMLPDLDGFDILTVPGPRFLRSRTLLLEFRANFRALAFHRSSTEPRPPLETTERRDRRDR